MKRIYSVVNKKQLSLNKVCIMTWLYVEKIFTVVKSGLEYLFDFDKVLC